MSKNFKQILGIRGANKQQTAAAAAIRDRAYAEGQVSAGAAGVGVAAGVLAGIKSSSFFARMVTAAPVIVSGGAAAGEAAAGSVIAGEVVAGAAGLTIVEGTLMGTVVTVGGPIVVGTAVGLGAMWGARKIGNWIINRDKNTSLEAEIANGGVVVASDEKEAADWIKAGTAMCAKTKIKEDLVKPAKAEKKAEEGTADKSPATEASNEAKAA
jgi:hypothetical protein